MIRLVLSIAGLGLVAGCVAIGANADFDRRVDFATYRTFALEPPPRRVPPNLPGYSELAGDRIMRQIGDALLARGLREMALATNVVVEEEAVAAEVVSTPGGSELVIGDGVEIVDGVVVPRRGPEFSDVEVLEEVPDLLVAIRVAGSERTSQARWEESDRGIGWSDQRRYESANTVHFVEGVLVIDMFDTQRQRIVWHGWATADVYAHSDGLRLATRAVEDLMALFPPDPKAD